MRDELEQFENRSDDWLAKQRKYEDRVSVWDFDEARKIKLEHATNHKAYVDKVQNIRNLRINNRSQSEKMYLPRKEKTLVSSIFITIFTIFMIIYIVTMLLFK